MLSRAALVLAIAAGLIFPASASAGGTFTVDAVNNRILFDGSQGGQDKIAGFDNGATIRFTRFGGDDVDGGAGCVISSDGQSADCDKTGVTAVVLNLGGGDDVAAIAAAVELPVFFNGGNGNDGLFGGGGTDTFDGGPGDDNVVARDGRAEQVDCSSGNDTAITDDADQRASCEQVEGDADGDGVRRPVDCDDTRPGVRPGVPDAPDDGVDQDCSGADATVLDRDRDGFGVPQDCNDADAAIRPGAAESIGNGVDENCDGQVIPYPPIPGSVANAWEVAGRGVRNLRLSVRGFPRATQIELRCTGPGCPRGTERRRPRARGRTDLQRFLGRRALRKGATVQVSLALSGHVGRVLRFRIRSSRSLPVVDFLCQRPGERATGC